VDSSVRDCIEIWFNFCGLDMIQIKDTARWGVWLGRYISQIITEVSQGQLSADRNHT